MCDCVRESVCVRLCVCVWRVRARVTECRITYIARTHTFTHFVACVCVCVSIRCMYNDG